MDATACKDKKITAAKGGKATKPNKFPLTGSEVVQIFAQERHQERLELYFLKEVDGDSYRYPGIRIFTFPEVQTYVDLLMQ